MRLLHLSDPSGYHLTRESALHKKHETVVPSEAVAPMDNLANLELE
jgi:hypothetical protein